MTLKSSSPLRERLEVSEAESRKNTKRRRVEFNISDSEVMEGDRESILSSERHSVISDGRAPKSILKKRFGDGGYYDGLGGLGHIKLPSLSPTGSSLSGSPEAPSTTNPAFVTTYWSNIYM